MYLKQEFEMRVLVVSTKELHKLRYLKKCARKLYSTFYLFR